MSTYGSKRLLFQQKTNLDGFHCIDTVGGLIEGDSELGIGEAEGGSCWQQESQRQESGQHKLLVEGLVTAEMCDGIAKKGEGVLQTNRIIGLEAGLREANNGFENLARERQNNVEQKAGMSADSAFC